MGSEMCIRDRTYKATRDLALMTCLVSSATALRVAGLSWVSAVYSLQVSAYAPFILLFFSFSFLFVELGIEPRGILPPSYTLNPIFYSLF